ncbi:MAG: flavodoxin family protein [Candidatus Aureabacteria bacterium]|nr:flavodoxin family protein [Candidatus Auribacterota bacterium]
MKAIAINASPRMDKGITATILNPFLDGMRKAGAEVEVYCTKKLRINQCQGEFSCWLKTPGKCFQKDDMQMLLPKLAGADVYVFATPVYVDGMTGPLKNLLDRIVPLGQPFFELRDGHCRHPGRAAGGAAGKVVLVSTCGFWEMDNFDPLLAHMKAICRNLNREFAGALLRPHGPALNKMAASGAPVNDIFEAAETAGRQLVQEGRLSSQSLATVSRTLLPLEAYVQAVNQNFRQALGDGPR